MSLIEFRRDRRGLLSFCVKRSKEYLADVRYLHKADIEVMSLNVRY